MATSPSFQSLQLKSNLTYPGILQPSNNSTLSLYQYCAKQNGTGWATVVAVSAVLEQVGVSADSETVVTLANQGHHTHRLDGSAQEQLSDTATAVASPKTRMVHWPSIIDFLEDGLESQVKTCATTPECKKRQLRSASPEVLNQSKAPRLDVEQAIARAEEMADDNENPENTPEANKGRGDEFANKGSVRTQSQISLSCNGVILLNEGLSRIDAGLRALECNGNGLPPSQIASMMGSIRGILEEITGVQSSHKENCRPAADRKGPRDGTKRAGNPEGTAGRGVREDAFETERLTQGACTAGKRGDIAALKVSKKTQYSKRLSLAVVTPL